MTTNDAAPSGFTTNIDNPFMTLTPGTTFVYDDAEAGAVTTVTVTRQTKVIDGVTCVVVHDVARENGIVVEDTYDWFAQDAEGNVWYFGEDTRAFKPGNPNFVSTEGSWKAGVDGARPGIVMLADPDVGDRYRQEFAPGVAEDRAKVLSLDANADVIYGSYDNVLKTKDINPLDPSVEHKYYVRGVGNILTVDADGARDQLTDIIVKGTSSGDHLTGYAGGDSLYGWRGDDRILGLNGADSLHGGRGDDALNGGRSADDLNGGAGDDWLRGGDGADTFLFHNLRDGVVQNDVIVDYRKSEIDVIDLPGGKASVVDQDQSAGGWKLTLAGDGDIIILRGVVDRNHDGHILDDLLVI
jgi:Ca2+-binding RTX toxin-like protein